MFRSSQADHIGSFADNLGIAKDFRGELVAAMLAFEIAFYKGWHNLWPKTDSKLLILAIFPIKTIIILAISSINAVS